MWAAARRGRESVSPPVSGYISRLRTAGARRSGTVHRCPHLDDYAGSGADSFWGAPGPADGRHSVSDGTGAEDGRSDGRHSVSEWKPPRPLVQRWGAHFFHGDFRVKPSIAFGLQRPVPASPSSMCPKAASS